MSLYDRDYMRAGPVPFGQRLRGINAFHAVLILNLGVFVAQWLFKIGWVHDPLTLQPIMPKGGVSLTELSHGNFSSMFTYMFVHGSLGHILLNMLLLCFAGKKVQDLFGSLRFLQIYLLAGIMGAALELTVLSYVSDNPDTMLIGASASCFGMLTAYAVARPNDRIAILLAFVIPIQGRVRVLTAGLVGLNLVLGILGLMDALPDWLSGGSDAAVAYFAHLGGAISGWYLARKSGIQEPFIRHSRHPIDFHEARRRRPVVARVARQPLAALDTEPKDKPAPSEPPVVDLIRDEIDPLLDKIADQGIQSLTDEELTILRRASNKIAQRQINRPAN